MLKQQTLKGSFSLNGKGLHTGVKLTVTFNPAPEHYGYKIQRIDLDDQPILDAVAENVVDTTRGTVLAKNGVKVSTVEHALAALYAAGIDNCLIQVDGPEFPILDGSAKAYVECIKRVGIEEQAAPKDYYIIKSKIEFRDEETGSSIIVLPDDKFSVNTLISYDSKILTNQYATLENMECFPTEIASARTFVFVREIEPLLNAGLIKGGDLDNAIVIYEKQMTQENFDKLADVMGVPHMDASHLGYINHIPLVWPNEPARHKLLDIIGDLALVGKPIKGRIIATRPGHTINILAYKFISISTRSFNCNSVCNSLHAFKCFNFTVANALLHRRSTCRLNTVNLAIRIDLLNSICNTCDKSAAADWHNYCVNIRKLLKNFKADCTLACNYIRVIKRVNKCITLFFLKFDSFVISIIINTFYKANICTVTLCSFNLTDWRTVRQADK